MRSELASIAAQQNGIFTRAQAVAAGYTHREIRSLTREYGEWATVRRGVYATRRLLDRVDPHEGMMRLVDRAVHLTTPVMHVLSHDSAARAHGLGFLWPREKFVHLTRPVYTGSRNEHGVKHHRARVQPGDIETVDGMPVTGLARTAIDLARAHGRRTGLTACDSAMRMGISRRELEQQMELMVSWPGITVARTCVDLADPGAENPAESLARLLLLDLESGHPETQFPVRTPTGPAWVDLRLGRLLVEFDGRTKYVDRVAGGHADGPVEDVVWAEKVREDHLRAAGFEVARVVWQQVLSGSATTGLRLADAYDRALATYGPELTPAQQAYADEWSGVRRERIRRHAHTPAA